MFVESLDELVLAPDDEHHLAASLRLSAGDPLTASDGYGRWLPCRFGNPLQAAGNITTVERPDPQLVVAFALIKGTRPELVVQKLTELGVDRIMPFVAERSVVRVDPQRVGKQTSRLRTCGARGRDAEPPGLDGRDPPAGEFDQIAGLEGAVRCDLAGRTLRRSDTCLLIGPEGGWSDQERAALPEAVTLGPGVLRSETAAIAAATLAAGLRAGVVDSIT